MADASPSTIDCDVGGLGPGLATIDSLARLQLAARRLGLELRFHNASRDLADLAALAGLDCVLGVEVGRQPEQRKERLRVEEERELSDPPA